MKKISKILVPIDFSSTATQAFHYALKLASILGAELHLLHVIYPQVENIDQPMISSDRATITKKYIVEQKMQQLLEITAADWTKAGKIWPVTASHVEVGGAIAVIRAQVKKQGFELIVMGTRGEHETLEKRLGTIASDVVGNAACPVIVVPEYAGEKDIAKVAHAVAPAWMGFKELLDTASCLQALHQEVHLVWFNKTINNGIPVKLTQLKVLLEQQLGEIPISIHNMKKQELVRDMNDFINREGIDLLIMYRSQLGIFRKLFHRSQTREMARKTKIPLLVV